MEHAVKKIILFTYDKEEVVEAETLLSPPFERITKQYGKWDQSGGWRMGSLRDILEMITGFQESMFHTLYNCEQVSNHNWEQAVAIHKVFMTAFLNKDSVYMEFVE